jgi:The  BURPS668_1122 family of deaminases
MQLLCGGLVVGAGAVSAGVMTGGVVHAAPPSPPETAPLPGAGAGLTLASASKVRVLAGRETKFWLEGERAGAVTSAVFEFPSASGAVRAGPVDGAGSPDRPAVTHVFDVVGASLPIVVTVTIDGATERFETTLEVVAVDPVGQEIEPPAGNARGGSSSPSPSPSVDLPAVPDGALFPGSDDSGATAAGGVSLDVDPQRTQEGSRARDSSSATSTSSDSSTPPGGGSEVPIGALLAPVVMTRRRDLELVDESGNPVEPRLLALEAERARIDGLDAAALEVEGRNPDDESGPSPDLRDGLSFSELYTAYRRSRSAEDFVGLLVGRLAVGGYDQILSMTSLNSGSTARRSNFTPSNQIEKIIQGLVNTDDPAIAYLLKMVNIAKVLEMASVYGYTGGEVDREIDTGGRSRETILDDLLKIVAPELLVGKRLDGARGGAIVGSLGPDDYVSQGTVADSAVGLLQGDDKAVLLGQISNTSIGLGAGNDSLGGLFQMSGGTINGDGGDDSIDATGRFEKVAISGDEGNDTIAVRGELSDTTINGDLGNDTITLAGNGTRNRINGRDGDDKIAVGGNLTETTIDLGPGIDQLVIADNFRGSLIVIDPDISRANKNGDNLREQDSLLLQGNGWVKIAELIFERRDAAGTVIATVSLGDPGATTPEQNSVFFKRPSDNKTDEIEFVGVVVDGQVREVFRNIAPTVDQTFLDGVLSWVRPVLTIAAIVTTGGAATTVALASGAVNTIDAVANNNPFGAVLGLASIVAPAVSIDGAPALGKTIGDVTNGIKTGTALVQSGFNPTALLGTLSYTLGVTGNQEGALAADVVQTIGTAVSDGKITIDTAIGLLGTTKRINDLAQAQQAARQQGFDDGIFLNALLDPDDPDSRSLWEAVGFSPFEGDRRPEENAEGTTSLNDDPGTLVAGEPMARPEPARALKALAKKLNRSPEYLVDLARLGPNRFTEDEWDEANRVARDSGFGDLKNLVSAFKTDVAQSSAKQQRFELPSGRPALQFDVSGNPLARNDAVASGFNVLSGTAIIPDTRKGGVLFARMSLWRDLGKGIYEPPKGASQEFLDGYREVAGYSILDSAWTFISGFAPILSGRSTSPVEEPKNAPKGGPKTTLKKPKYPPQGPMNSPDGTFIPQDPGVPGSAERARYESKLLPQLETRLGILRADSIEDAQAVRTLLNPNATLTAERKEERKLQKRFDERVDEAIKNNRKPPRLEGRLEELNIQTNGLFGWRSRIDALKKLNPDRGSEKAKELDQLTKRVELAETQNKKSGREIGDIKIDKTNVAALGTLWTKKTGFIGTSAVSGAQNDDRSLGLGASRPVDPVFSTTEAPNAKGRQIARDADAEYLVLENLAAKLGAPNGQTGSVHLVVDRTPCASCSNVFNQWKVRYPNVDLNVFLRTGAGQLERFDPVKPVNLSDPLPNP